MDFFRRKITVVCVLLVILFVLIFKPENTQAVSLPGQPSSQVQYAADKAHAAVVAAEASRQQILQQGAKEVSDVKATLNQATDAGNAANQAAALQTAYNNYANDYYDLASRYDNNGNKLYAGAPDAAALGARWRSIPGTNIANPFSDPYETLADGTKVPMTEARMAELEYSLLKSAVLSDQSILGSFEKKLANDYGVDPNVMSNYQYISKELAGASRQTADKGTAAIDNGNKDEPIICFQMTPPFVIPLSCMALVSFTMLKVSSFGLMLTAMVFNITIDYTLNFKNFLTSRASIVTLGWTSFRDLANLFFIFILLYIGISTIINNGGYNAKTLLVKVLISAALINFSLFFTQAMIDVSNIVSLQFYNKITEGARASLSKNAGNGQSQANSANSDIDSGISAGIVNALGLQDIWTLGARSSSVSGETGRASGSSFDGIGPLTLLLYGVGGSLFVLVTAFVLGAAAFMFLFRAITLIFLMVLSPLAFAGQFIPSTSGYAKEWWSKLMSNLIFAPVYMALMYVVLSVVFSQAGKPGQASFLAVFKGGADGAEVALTFFVLIGLMWGCLMIATKLGAKGASSASSFGSKWGKAAGAFAGGIVGGATLGVAAHTGRTLIGGSASALANTDFMKNRSGIIGTRALKSLRGVAGASFDARNVGEVGKKLGLGTGAVGGFTAEAEAKQKARVEFGKTLGDTGKRKFAERSLRSKFSGSKRKAGKELLTSSYDDSLKEHNEGMATLTSDLRSFKSNRDIKRAEELRLKGTSRTADEGTEFLDLVDKLKKTDVKYTTFEEVDGKMKFVPKSGTIYDATQPVGSIWVTDRLEKAQKDAIDHRVDLQRQRQEAKKGQIPKI